jgi:hypothetical protein
LKNCKKKEYEKVKKLLETPYDGHLIVYVQNEVEVNHVVLEYF